MCGPRWRQSYSTPSYRATSSLESDLPLVRRPSFLQAQSRWEQWALDPVARAQLQSYCVICNMWLGSSKHVKQHFHRTHAMRMPELQAKANTLCLTFRSQLTRGRACLFCRAKVGAPKTHSQQCTVLFQLTIAHLFVQDSTRPHGGDDGEVAGKHGGGHLPPLLPERCCTSAASLAINDGRSGSRGDTSSEAAVWGASAEASAPSLDPSDPTHGTRLPSSAASGKPVRPGPLAQQDCAPASRCAAAAAAGPRPDDVPQAGLQKHPTVDDEHGQGVAAKEGPRRPGPCVATEDRSPGGPAKGAAATIASYFGYGRGPRIRSGCGLDDGRGRLELHEVVHQKPGAFFRMPPSQHCSMRRPCACSTCCTATRKETLS